MGDGGTTETLTLRVKLGENEFKAFSASNTLISHFAVRQRLIGASARNGADPAGAIDGNVTRSASVARVFNVDARRRLLSLRLYPAGKTADADAALLLLYGFHQI